MPCNVCDPAMERRMRVGGGPATAIQTHFEGCPECGAQPRIRAMRRLVETELAPRLSGDPSSRRALLISAVAVEMQLLQPYCGSVTTASLFGEYSNQHVHSNIVDLKEFGAASFDLVHACCVLDFVPEIEQALKSVHRVLSVGGWFSMHNSRIRHDERDRDKPPYVKKLRENYTAKYYPEGYQQPIVCMGRDWFMRTMKQLGFEVHECRFDDPFSEKTLWWYFSRKIK